MVLCCGQLTAQTCSGCSQLKESSPKQNTLLKTSAYTAEVRLAHAVTDAPWRSHLHNISTKSTSSDAPLSVPLTHEQLLDGREGHKLLGVSYSKRVRACKSSTAPGATPRAVLWHKKWPCWLKSQCRITVEHAQGRSLLLPSPTSLTNTRTAVLTLQQAFRSVADWLVNWQGKSQISLARITERTPQADFRVLCLISLALPKWCNSLQKAGKKRKWNSILL